MEKDLREITEYGGNLVGNAFRRMVMPRVDRQQSLPAERVSKVKLVRTRRVAFRANPEKLRFNGVEVAGRVGGLAIDFIERLQQSLAGSSPICRCILHTVGNPEVRQASLSQGLSDYSPDLAPTDTVLDPKIAHVRVGLGQRKGADPLWVSEIGLVEI